MKLGYSLIISFLALPVCLFAHFTGTYRVSGFDPVSDSHYTGTVVITKSDHIYTAVWTFDNGGTDVGTGVRRGDSLSFVFDENNSGIFGVQLYDLDDCHLKGPWVRFGATVSGHEKLTKID